MNQSSHQFCIKASLSFVSAQCCKSNAFTSFNILIIFIVVKIPSYSYSTKHLSTILILTTKSQPEGRLFVSILITMHDTYLFTLILARPFSSNTTSICGSSFMNFSHRGAPMLLISDSASRYILVPPTAGI